MTIHQQHPVGDQGGQGAASPVNKRPVGRSVSEGPSHSHSNPVSRLRQLLPRIHVSKDADQHTKRGSAAVQEPQQHNTAGGPRGQPPSRSQQPQQQPQAQQQAQQQQQHRWHRHHQQPQQQLQQQLQQQPVPIQAPGPLAGSSAQAAAGKAFSSSAAKQRIDRGCITVTASAHSSGGLQQQQHHHHHHHHHHHQQPQLVMQQQHHHHNHHQQQQQQLAHGATMRLPLISTAAAAADSPSSLLLPPPSAHTAGQPHGGPQGPPVLPAELDQRQCKRVVEVLLKCGKPAEACVWAQAALAADPWNVELLLLRGRALEAAGNVPGAFTSYSAALAHSPQHLPTLMAIASLYKARGMLDEAQTTLRTALQAAEAAAAGGGSSGDDGSSAAAAGAAAAGVAQAAGSSSNLGGGVSAGIESTTPLQQQQQRQRQEELEEDMSTSSSSSNAHNNDGGAAAGAAAAAVGAAVAQSTATTAAGAAGDVPIAAVREALAVVLTDLGTRAKNAGRLSECEALYREALALCPSYPSAHYNLGVLASESRRWLDALQHYKDTLTLAPHHAQALCNSGVVYRELDRLEEAVAAYQEALAVAPNYPIVRNNLAVALTDLGTTLKVRGQLKAGIACYERALALMPRHADALYNLGVACAEDGQTERALFCYELTTHFNPSCAEAWNNLGVLHKEADNLERAAECYMAALNIRPNFPQSLNNLAVVLTSQGKAGEALSLLQAAMTACPTYAEAHNNLGVLQRDVGVIPDALASYERALQLVPDSRNAGQNKLLALNYIYQGEDPVVCAAHVEWGRAFQAQYAQQVLPEVLPSQRDTTPGRPLRVGYMSPDLFTHSVSYFAEAPLSHHNPSRVQLFVYSCVGKPDVKTARLQAQVLAAGGIWRDVARLSEPALAQLVRQDEIDILVELTGHTANNRLGVCAMRAAPVQVTWIGYPNSTGLSAVDYRFTDALCDPEDTDQTFAEELVRLPGCFLCYTPAPDPPPVAPLPAALNGFVTFGSFNNLAKITPQVLSLWARILQSIPTSRLVLKAKPFSCSTARQHIASQLEAAGVASWRFDLLPLTASTQDHLGVYSLMDISLDPFPYTGTTTTAESLFMGVPVITLAGRCHAHNVSVSLLTAVGIEADWVAQDEEQYLHLAVQHAANIPALQRLRAGLRQDMLASRLCDAVPFVSDLEDVYESLWQRWVEEGGRQKPILGMPRGLTQEQQQQAEVAGSSTPAPKPAAAAAGSAQGGSSGSSRSSPGTAARGSRRSSSDRGNNSGGSSADPAHDSSGGSGSSGVASAVLQKAAASAGPGGGGATTAAAGGGAGVLDSSSDSSSLQKGRKLSSSCDAAATAHAAAATAAAAEAAGSEEASDDTRQVSDLQAAAAEC